MRGLTGRSRLTALAVGLVMVVGLGTPMSAAAAVATHHASPALGHGHPPKPPKSGYRPEGA